MNNQIKAVVRRTDARAPSCKVRALALGATLTFSRAFVTAARQPSAFLRKRATASAEG